jgi:hypothetical protein
MKNKHSLPTRRKKKEKKVEGKNDMDENEDFIHRLAVQRKLMEILVEKTTTSRPESSIDEK